MRAGALIKEANRTRQMYEAFHAMHAACYYHMFAAWKQRGLGIADFGYLKKEIEGLAMRKPGMLLRNLRAYENRNNVPAAGMKKGDFASFG